MVASLFQILIGFTGLVGFVVRFVGPLTVAPTVSLIGLSLFDAAGLFSGDKSVFQILFVLSLFLSCANI